MTARAIHTRNSLGVSTMLLYEDLARARMLEAEQAASKLRLVRRLTAAKRWNRVSKWAAKRAARASSL
ncbi:hypothetical protein EV192_1021133 [Actinocrispum wychmicini]|uniref:Uncharacterized protein n=2 Tax=Actinocrispum wychmicini TaxID=1213861 RepID=A0A4R2K076_9PSEU|nr:hypothetical protein EV192_1021133 [Actinocrispum wychmicini]